MRALPEPAHGWSSVPGPLESFGQSLRGAAEAVGAGVVLVVAAVAALVLAGSGVVADALAEAPAEGPASEQPARRTTEKGRASSERARIMAGEANGPLHQAQPHRAGVTGDAETPPISRRCSLHSRRDPKSCGSDRTQRLRIMKPDNSILANAAIGDRNRFSAATAIRAAWVRAQLCHFGSGCRVRSVAVRRRPLVVGPAPDRRRVPHDVSLHLGVLQIEIHRRDTARVVVGPDDE